MHYTVLVQVVHRIQHLYEQFLGVVLGKCALVHDPVEQLTSSDPSGVTHMHTSERTARVLYTMFFPCRRLLGS